MKIVTFADGFPSVSPPTIDDYVLQAELDALQAELDAHEADTNNPHSVTKSQVGLSNVPNVDATNPSNIIQDSTHRFVTDAEKTLWNAGGVTKLNYSPLVTWASTAANGSFGFSLDTKVMYYVVDGELQEVALMKTISGTITQAQITVGTTAVRATVTGSAPSASRKRLMIMPDPTNAGGLWLGGSSVTAGSGKQIVGPDTIFLDWDASDYYLISDTPAQKAQIIEVV